MKKRGRHILSVLLCCVLLFGVTAPSVGAAYVPGVTVNEKSTGIEKYFYNALDKVIDKVVGRINAFIPDPGWESAEDYEPVGVMRGTGEFLDSPAEGAYWSMGYGSQSLITGDETDGKHFVGGSLSLSDKTATSLWDDLRVRTVALSDNSGRGTVVIAVIDSYGMARGEVNKIREAMADFCEEKGIVSLNISVLHQHSAVDTFGMNGSITAALLNPLRAKAVNGINDDYMKNLYEKLRLSVETAVDAMRPGRLYHGSADFSMFITDKRDPQVLDSDFDRFRFVPESGGREIWFTTSAIHCVGNGAGNTDLTGDYPYYMEQVINEEYNADFIMILTAEQGTSQDKSTVTTEDMSGSDALAAYGEALADCFASIHNEKEVAPLLNIASEEVSYPITNQILIFAGKMGLLTNTVIKDSDGYRVVTEIGYMELGEDIAVALVPGEAPQELFTGGCLSAADSWSGEDWTLPPVADYTVGRELIVFGITNDQIGYIIPDNDYMALLAPENKSLELVSTGKGTASAMARDFHRLITSCE